MNSVTGRVKTMPVAEFVNRFEVTEPARLSYLYRVSAQCKNDTVREMLDKMRLDDLLSTAAAQGFALAEVELLKTRVIDSRVLPATPHLAELNSIIQSGNEAAIFKLASEVVFNAVDRSTGIGLMSE